jgi:C-terminal processing protease CtpA/Prc
MRIALLTIAAVLATASVTAAEVEKKTEESQVEIEKKLEEARRRLDTAAREVAELSMSMSEHAMPSIRHFTRAGPPRAMLGINLGPRSDEEPEGIKVLSVSPGGAAEKAGLKAGDVLLAIGDKQLKKEEDLSAREVLLKHMGEVKPGEKVQLRYRRDGKVATASVTAEAPDRVFATMPMVRGRLASAPGMPFPMPQIIAARAIGVFGSAELVALTPKLGHYFGTEKGLLVVRAPDDSRLKLEDGDVIVDIDGRPPSSPAHAFRILGSYQAGEQLKLNVLRQKKRMSFEITIPENEPAAAHINPFLFHGGDDVIMHRPEGGMREHIRLAPGMPMPPPPPGEAGGRGFITIMDEPA